jgi:transcriptional accessory protein Tex/SPT6
MEELKPGMRIKGKVRNVVEFGAFIDIGVGRDGLAHISTLKRAGIDKSLSVGDEIDVQVRRVDTDTNRISLTVPGAGKGSKTALEDLQVQSLVTGRVVRLVDFGAFVDIGAQTDGLLHVSQMSGSFVNHPSEVVKVGDEIEVRVIEIDSERHRISLTMKSGEEAPAPREQEQERPTRAPAYGGRERSDRGDRGDRGNRGERGDRGDRGGRSQRRQPVVISTATDEESHGPTAFEVAWEKAMTDRKRGH